MSVPLSLEKLVTALARLPGVGQKTAQRLAFSLLRDQSGLSDQLATAISNARREIHFCERCFSYAENPLCPICQDPRRDHSSICVVEQPVDIYVIERSRVFDGVYHVLMGSISPLDGIGPQQLKIAELLQRITQANQTPQPIQEIIMATNPSMNGEATALHLANLLKEHDLRLTRLARGIPVGGSLEYADDITLDQAFQGRQNLSPSTAKPSTATPRN